MVFVGDIEHKDVGRNTVRAVPFGERGREGGDG